ncbi:MAG: PqqD family protein [Gemmatimonadaceae bacterium]|nr:PqqD family protein [Gemmatimonadaceae bacterium]
MRYRIATDTLAATLSDGAVLLSLHTKRYFSLNETGTRVWALLGEAKSADEIAAALAGEYAVSGEEARAAVDALIAELVAEQLLEVLPS